MTKTYVTMIKIFKSQAVVHMLAYLQLDSLQLILFDWLAFLIEPAAPRRQVS